MVLMLVLVAFDGIGIPVRIGSLYFPGRPVRIPPVFAGLTHMPGAVGGRPGVVLACACVAIPILGRSKEFR